MTLKRAVFIVLFAAIVILIFAQAPKNAAKTMSAPEPTPIIVDTLPPTPSPIASPSTSASASAGIASIRYPNPNLTPGATVNVPIDELCLKNYPSQVKPLSETIIGKVFTEYGLSYPPEKGTYEVDHLIPVEIGGSNNLANLWPQPAFPKPGFHEKNKTEAYLRQQVCSGAISVSTAQSRIKTDWYAVYQKMP